MAHCSQGQRCRAALHWLPVGQHITYHLAVIIFTVIHIGEPTYRSHHLTYWQLSKE
jgi:hypothetical protein